MNKYKDLVLKKYGLVARLVCEGDAEFILKLRTDESLSEYLHSTDNDIEKQKEWIRAYKEREEKGEEFYFIFYVGNNPIGLERIYSLTYNSFTHGSFVFAPNSPLGSSVKGDMITREFGFDILCKQYNYFTVSKGNKGVIAFHKRYKPEIITEDDESYSFMLTKENFQKYKSIYIRTFNIK